MLTRRGFAGFASCAICGITEFVATEASAQGAPPAAAGGVTRKILSQTDGPTPGYETLLVEATIEAGVAVGRHTHPGIESAYVLEGGFELPIQGQPTRTLKPGDAFPNPAGHATCGRQGGHREVQNSEHLCGAEGKTARISSSGLSHGRAGELEHFPEKWTPVFRRKCDQIRNLEPLRVSRMSQWVRAKRGPMTGLSEIRVMTVQPSPPACR